MIRSPVTSLESQIYRIDHYLGKETVQNLIALRFANPLFGAVWDHNHISHVEITVAEKIGIEGRWGYFDQAGQMRDMVQKPPASASVPDCYGTAR